MKNKNKIDIIESQMNYFRDLYTNFKGTPMSVSSESQAHKELRYQQISNLFLEDDLFSIHDVGMGVADFKTFLMSKFPEKKINYSGSDVLSEYCELARSRFPSDKFFERDISKKTPNDKYHYVILSGVFHQKREVSIRDWEIYIERIILSAYSMCKKAIAFNFISPFVDFYQPEVYYCNLPKILFFINDKLSRFFTIQHNYALFEFTVYVYNEKYIEQKFPQPEFQKYFYR